jgi:hypothetical protein
MTRSISLLLAGFELCDWPARRSPIYWQTISAAKIGWIPHPKWQATAEANLKWLIRELGTSRILNPL